MASPRKEKLAFKSRVPDQKAGMHLIDYLCERFTYHPREKWLQNIKEGELLLNGSKPSASKRLSKGDELTYVTEKRKEPKVPRRIPILFEDKDLIVVNKPAQLPVHPGGKYLKNTLLSLLKKQKRLDFLILAHRLDRETSGCCVLSKSPLAKEKMYWSFFNSEVEKHYRALVWGIPQKHGSIDIPIGQATQKGKKALSAIRIKQIARGYQAKRALTKYKLLKTLWLDPESLAPPPWPCLEHYRRDQERIPVSLLDCQPITGRTNQIRVHMAEIGHGIVGDKLYDPEEEIFLQMTKQKPILEGERGDAGPRLEREAQQRLLLHSQALHAHSLRFRHPRSGRWLKVEAPLPNSWSQLDKRP